MPTNVFFNNFGAQSEQTLIEDLIIESIKMYGHEVYYLPRETVDLDEVFNEDTLTKFEDSYLIEAYIKNVEGFEGEGDFVSRFGLEYRDRITFTVAKRRFEQDISQTTFQTLPHEGDLIHFNMNQKLYEVKYVEHESIFYQMGSLQTYDIVCELFEYSNEQLNTGVSSIDSIEETLSIPYALEKISLSTESGIGLITEAGSEIINDGFSIRDVDKTDRSAEFELGGSSIIDFSESNPFGEIK
jgi:hypothetical protein